MKLSDYLNVVNSDKFNSEIKALSNGRYIQSSIYAEREEKKQTTDDYKEKQRAIAKKVFTLGSIDAGMLSLL